MITTDDPAECLRRYAAQQGDLAIGAFLGTYWVPDANPGECEAADAEIAARYARIAWRYALAAAWLTPTKPTRTGNEFGAEAIRRGEHAHACIVCVLTDGGMVIEVSHDPDVNPHALGHVVMLAAKKMIDTAAQRFGPETRH